MCGSTRLLNANWPLGNSSERDSAEQDSSEKDSMSGEHKLIFWLVMAAILALLAFSVVVLVWMQKNKVKSSKMSSKTADESPAEESPAEESPLLKSPGNINPNDAQTHDQTHDQIHDQTHDQTRGESDITDSGTDVSLDRLSRYTVQFEKVTTDNLATTTDIS